MAVEIPVLLLKTRTVPEDGYEDYFSVPVMVEKGVMKFKPVFVPVLEHTPNAENLERLEALLRSGELKRRYGGMIFTSQRAVEGWRGVVERVEMRSENESESESGMVWSVPSSCWTSSVVGKLFPCFALLLLRISHDACMYCNYESS